MPTTTEIRSLLETKAREIAISLGDRSNIQIDEPGDDEISVAVEAAHRDVSVLFKKRQMDTLRQIRLALDRVRDGIYGECVACEEPINPKRLAAIAWAARCVNCQEAHDQAVKCGDATPEEEPELEAA